jgi:hypothetical protein
VVKLVHPDTKPIKEPIRWHDLEKWKDMDEPATTYVASDAGLGTVTKL